MRMQFGSFELDDDRFELTCDGRVVALRPKVFDLLVVLVRERVRVVRREEIFERLWSTTAVGFGSLAGLVNELRTALGESGRGPSSIRTVHARGYQFVAPVRVIASGPSEAKVGRETSDPETPVAGFARETAQDLPGSGIDAGLGELRGRLCAAVDEVSRAGAQALVEPISGERDRSVWLAAAARAAIDVGFRTRFATAPGHRLDERPRQGSLSCGIEDIESDDSPDPRPGRCRVPIALLLEVWDPDAWGRAGGLRRLLDLLGRAPVLVVAALAANVGDPTVLELSSRDERIQTVPGSRAGLIPAEHRRGEAGAVGAEDLARTLSRLAHADRVGFEVALRSLGFEVSRIEPIRTLRRVGPTPIGSQGSLDIEAV